MQILSKNFKKSKGEIVENKSIETKNNAVNFYQNVEYVFSHLRVDQYQKLTKTLGSLKKIADSIKNAKI